MLENNKTLDLLGIGIGPFNLGLAALTVTIPELTTAFIDAKPSFDWHPGMLLPFAKMQVPFYADLVTLADPTSPYSYLAWLKATGKLFRFAINEAHVPYRSEYNDYCQWVAGQLPNLHFNQSCKDIRFDTDQNVYQVTTTTAKGKTETMAAKKIVLGVGTIPSVPACVAHIKHPLVFHSGEYLQHKMAALMNRRITIVGSGQSAAEIFMDLLPHSDNLESLSWFTQSNRFHPMDDSKLALEMSSPDYIDYFYRLDPLAKKRLIKEQQYLYKGINKTLVEEIYAALYLRGLQSKSTTPGLSIACELTAVRSIGPASFQLQFHHNETGKLFTHDTDTLILATGYRYRVPDFLPGIHNRINWTTNGNYDIARDYSIDDHHTVFVQNADLHSHGFNSADLGLGPYRNAVIINSILGREHYHIEKNNVFQRFG